MSRSRTTFKKGKSGNPAGRPKGAVGFAQRVREKTEDGADLIEILLSIAKDKLGDTRNRLMAVDMLMSRGLGKPAEHSDLVEVSARTDDADTSTTGLISNAKEVLGAEIERLLAMKRDGMPISDALMSRLTDCVRQIATLNEQELKLLEADEMAKLTDDELKQRVAQTERERAVQ